jgi:hypothetical protein
VSIPSRDIPYIFVSIEFFENRSSGKSIKQESQGTETSLVADLRWDVSASMLLYAAVIAVTARYCWRRGLGLGALRLCHRGLLLGKPVEEGLCCGWQPDMVGCDDVDPPP